MSDPVRPTSALERYETFREITTLARPDARDTSFRHFPPTVVFYLASEVDAKQQHYDFTMELANTHWHECEEQIDALRAEVARLTELLAAAPAGGRPTADWQPIESAPKDGTIVLGWCRHRPDIHAVVPTCWSRAHGAWVMWVPWHGVGPQENQPTHWMPLPAPPHDDTNNDQSRGRSGLRAL